MTTALAVLLILACGPRQAHEPFKFLAIADPHIASVEDLERWRAFLYSVRDRDVDFLLVLGDVVYHLPELLEPVKEIADQADLQVYFLPGNHDDNFGHSPEWWKAVFPHLYYAFEHKGTHFILNWSQDSIASLPWLEACLDSIPHGTPIVFCQHYPPEAYFMHPGKQWTLLRQRSEDVVVALSGHYHERRSESVGTINSETLDNCFLNAELDGHFYEISLNGDGTAKIEEFPLNALVFHPPADSPPQLRFKQDRGYFIIQDSLLMEGTARDEGKVSQVEWRIGCGPWQAAEGTESWKFSFSGSELTPGNHLLIVRARDELGQAGLAQVHLLDKDLLVALARLEQAILEQEVSGADYQDRTLENFRQALEAMAESRDWQLSYLESELTETQREFMDWIFDNLDRVELEYSLVIYKEFKSRHLRLGENYLRLDSLDQALWHLRQVLEISIPDWPLLNNLAQIFDRRGKPDSARVYYRRACELAPDSAQSSINLAVLLSRQGRKEEAVELLESFLRRHPGNFMAHYNLGNWLVELGNYLEAQRHYSKALEINPASANCHLNLGLIYLQYLGNPGAAVEHLKAFLELEPGHPQAGRIRSTIEYLESRP